MYSASETGRRPALRPEAGRGCSARSLHAPGQPDLKRGDILREYVTSSTRS